jgi:pyrimidine deaminase RibD-like protein
VHITSDLQAMQLALDWAEKGMFITAPNPRVGCVIVRDGKLLGAGHTQVAGGAHAEVQALRDAAAKGHEVRGATSGFGSCIAATTRARPAATSASAHGGVRPWWLHGSSVT